MLTASLALEALSGCASTAAATAESVVGPSADNVLLLLDVSATRPEGNELTLVRQTLINAAAKSAFVKIVAFSSSSADRKILYENVVSTEKKTQPAREKAAPVTADKLLPGIEKKLVAASSELNTGASDPTGQINAIAEFAKQVDGDIDAILRTDGIQTTGASLNADLTVEQAQQIATTVPIPKLPDTVKLSIVGIGITSGDPAPTSYVEALKAYWSIVCERAAATDRCLVATDVTLSGGGA